VVSKMRELLPAEGSLYTPYGATECLPVAVIESRELQNTRVHTEQGAGTCVGRALPANTVRIIAIDDAVITDWQDVQQMPIDKVGEITVAGPSATDAYFDRPNATALAKIRETLPDGSERIVHRMGDIGWIDAQGRIWFCGRKTHRVETANGPLYTEQVEPIFNTHPKVKRIALVGVGELGKQTPILCVELKHDADKQHFETIKAELLEIGSKFAHTAHIKTLLWHPKFPVDIRHNAKIGREILGTWAMRQLKTA
jgi:olefin beta-lactone synthetase